MSWTCALELNEKRQAVSGSEATLCRAIRNAADLRIYTGFRYNKHLYPGAANGELVQEVSDFRVTYLVDNRWAAGIMSQRMPIMPPDGFGPRASMSFFMYNQNGEQAIARPYLDGGPVTGKLGSYPFTDPPDMPKYHQLDSYDEGTNAPSQNFIYDFESFRYLVRDEWREVFACGKDGEVTFGSLKALTDEFLHGCEIKVGIHGLCADLSEGPDHELFVQTGPGYYSTESKVFCAGTQPVVRVKPAIPMRYQSRGWDFGWLMPRTDGFVARWLCDPYTLKFTKSEGFYAIRWFVR